MWRTALYVFLYFAFSTFLSYLGASTTEVPKRTGFNYSSANSCFVNANDSALPNASFIGLFNGKLELRRCSPQISNETALQCHKKFSYRATLAKNLIGQDNKEARRYAADVLQTLVYLCKQSAQQLAIDIEAFFCALYFPPCSYPPALPCRELCELVIEQCQVAFLTMGFRRPPQLNCTNFPKLRTNSTRGNNAEAPLQSSTKRADESTKVPQTSATPPLPLLPELEEMSSQLIDTASTTTATSLTTSLKSTSPTSFSLSSSSLPTYTHNQSVQSAPSYTSLTVSNSKFTTTMTEQSPSTMTSRRTSEQTTTTVLPSTTQKSNSKPQTSTEKQPPLNVTRNINKNTIRIEASKKTVSEEKAQQNAAPNVRQSSPVLTEVAKDPMKSAEKATEKYSSDKEVIAQISRGSAITTISGLLYAILVPVIVFNVDFHHFAL